MNFNLILSQTGLIIGIVAGVVVLLLICIVAWWIKTSNKFKVLSIKVDESFSSIDVALNQRYDQIIQLHQTVKGYMDYESETMAKIIAMRNPSALGSVAAKQEAYDMITAAQKELNALVEKYPDLMANALMANLQASINEIEENLAASRRLYNSNVSVFNQAIAVFPNSLVAKGLSPKEFFKADENKKERVDLNF